MVIGVIGSAGNFIQNILWRFGRILIKHPQYIIPLVAIILFFPLEIVDMLLYFIVNFFILFINIIILVLLIFINVIWGVVASVINLLIDAINHGIIRLVCKFWHPISDDNYQECKGKEYLSHIGGSIIPDFSFDYFDINLFGKAKDSIPAGSAIPFDCLFTLIMDLFNITALPIW